MRDDTMPPPRPVRPLGWPAQAAIALALLGAGGGAWVARDTLVAWFAPAAEAGGGGGDDRGGGQAAPAVLVVRAEAGRDDVVVRTLGDAVARRSVTLRALSAGRVDRVAITVGRRSEVGAALVELDARAERLALALAEARLAAAERRFARIAPLEGRGASSEASVDEARVAVEIARLEREDAARLLEDRILRAPFAGHAGIPSIDPGDRVEPSDAIAPFDDRAALYVEMTAPEAVAARIALGAPVSATTPAFPGETFLGRIGAIDSRLDPATRTLRLRAEIDNADDRLRPGMSLDVTLALDGPERPSVPEAALQYEGGAGFVWRIVDADGAEPRAERAAVRVRTRRAGLALVEPTDAERPLVPGDLVVVEGVQRLRDGRPVRLIGAAPPSKAATPASEPTQ